VTDLYPLGLRLSQRPVLVVGGGAIATRRVPALLAAGARVTVVSPTLTPALEGLADRIIWVPRRFQPSDVDDVWLVQVAVDDPDAATAVSAACEERRVFCVRADDRNAASAWTPAVTRHGPVTVAVLGGGSPRLSMAVRDQIAALLAAGAPAEGRGLRGTVALVGGGPGDPELITVKGRRLLNEADVVVADGLAPGLLLDELRPQVEVVDVAKLPYGAAATQDFINQTLVSRALAGKFVVRLKGGDPFVFGRGGEEAVACASAGVPVVVVPGVTSAVAVPGFAGIPVTHRGVTHGFTVVSGHVPPSQSLVDWAAVARSGATIVVLMGLRHLAEIASVLMDAGLDPATPAAAIQEGTTSRQVVVRAPLSSIATAAASLRTPVITVIGAVVSTLSS
jgi:uroporphyrin-III C-methyltransferase/precorrin-2 dehydrogenase/sirohydrochlorin ferrochelatase